MFQDGVFSMGFYDDKNLYTSKTFQMRVQRTTTTLSIK